MMSKYSKPKKPKKPKAPKSKKATEFSSYNYLENELIINGSTGIDIVRTDSPFVSDVYNKIGISDLPEDFLIRFSLSEGDDIINIVKPSPTDRDLLIEGGIGNDKYYVGVNRTVASSLNTAHITIINDPEGTDTVYFPSVPNLPSASDISGKKYLRFDADFGVIIISENTEFISDAAGSIVPLSFAELYQQSVNAFGVPTPEV